MKEILFNISNELLVLLISMLPFVEVRGAIPVGMSLGLSPLTSITTAYLGSLIPMPFIIKFTRPIFSKLKQKNLFKNLIDKIERKSNLKWDKIKKYKVLALFIFTAIPLPGTGVWSASLMASLLNLRVKTSIYTIALGNIISTMLVSIMSHIIIN